MHVAMMYLCFRLGQHNMRPAKAFLVACESFFNCRNCCKSTEFLPDYCTTTRTFSAFGNFMLINLALRPFCVVQVC